MTRLNPRTIRARIDQIRSDPAHPFQAGDRVATAEMLQLYELLDQSRSQTADYYNRDAGIALPQPRLPFPYSLIPDPGVPPIRETGPNHYLYVPGQEGASPRIQFDPTIGGSLPPLPVRIDEGTPLKPPLSSSESDGIIFGHDSRKIPIGPRVPPLSPRLRQ